MRVQRSGTLSSRTGHLGEHSSLSERGRARLSRSYVPLYPGAFWAVDVSPSVTDNVAMIGNNSPLIR